MEKILEIAEELSKKTGFSLEESVKIILMYQQNKFLEKLVGKAEIDPLKVIKCIN